MKQTLIASKFPLPQSFVESVSVPPELTADYVLHLLRRELEGKTLTYQDAIIRLDVKGKMARLIVRKDKDSVLCSSLDHQDGFVFKTKLIRNGRKIQDLLIFYKPFSREFFCLNAEYFKVKKLVGIFSTQRRLRPYEFELCGEQVGRVYQILRKSIRFVSEE